MIGQYIEIKCHCKIKNPKILLTCFLLSYPITIWLFKSLTGIDNNMFFIKLKVV